MLPVDDGSVIWMLGTAILKKKNPGIVNAFFSKEALVIFLGGGKTTLSDIIGVLITEFQLQHGSCRQSTDAGCFSWMNDHRAIEGNTTLHLQTWWNTVIIPVSVWYQDKPQISLKCFSLGSKNTEQVKSVERLLTAPTSLLFLWQRKTEASIYIPFFHGGWTLNENSVCF